MLTQWLLQTLFPTTATLFHHVQHIANGMQWHAHCRWYVTFPKQWHPHKMGKWQYDGSIHWVCRFYDKAGTMHPARTMLRSMGRLMARLPFGK